MRDAEWTLEYPGVSLSWGAPGDRIYLDGPPEIAPGEITTDDTNRPRADGVAFGLDYRGGATITFALAVVADDEEEARDLAASFSRAWRADAVRRSPGSVATLRSRLGSRIREVYGRPRRFAQDDTHAPNGIILLTVDFACVDDLAYSPEERVASIGFVPPPSGGLLSPLASPLSTVPAASTPDRITVGGEVEAWPVVTIRGPITNPVVQVTNVWSLALALSIPAGESVTVDTRPWRRSITRESDGASLAGALTRSSVRLARTALPPGPYAIALRGVDGTGTSALTFRVRDTFTSL